MSPRMPQSLFAVAAVAAAAACWAAPAIISPAWAQVPSGPGFFGAVDGRWMWLGGDRVQNGLGGVANPTNGPGGQALVGWKFDSSWDVALAGGVQQILTDITNFRNGRLTVDVNRQNLDAEVGYSTGDWRFNAGLRGIHYQQVVAFTTPTVGGTDTRDVWGIGPKIGAGYRYALSDEFALVGGADAALVFANFSDYGTGVVIGNGNYWQLVPQVGGELGVSWRPDSTPGFAVTVGGRVDAWFNTVITTNDGVGRGTLLNIGPFVRLAYNFSGPYPRSLHTPPPAAPEAPARAPTHMVFFDFDSAAITQTARATIQQAANDARAGRATNISVTGHADRSGSDGYNMALSQRRAEAVRAELIRTGIAAQQIVVAARGESEPLVPTADGVREPQNRRVTISF